MSESVSGSDRSDGQVSCVQVCIYKPAHHRHPHQQQQQHLIPGRTESEQKDYWAFYLTSSADQTPRRHGYVVCILDIPVSGRRLSPDRSS